MEMSNNFDLPELHVAQQRRRDKLRLQPLHEFQPITTTHNNDRNINVGSPMMLLSPEMFNYAVAATPPPPLPSAHHPPELANIYPSRFVAPSSPDSHHHPQPPLNWVQSFMHNQVDFRTLHNHDDDPDHPSEIVYPNGGPSGNNNTNSDYNELPLLPGDFDPSSYGGHGHGHGRGLSLSLSSGLIHGPHHTGEPRELKPLESGAISSAVMKLNSGSSSHPNVQDNNVGGSRSSSIQVHTNVGPLGPFTGYTAILTNSKFGKPAQHLLDEIFGAGAAGWRDGEDSETDLIGSKSFRGGSSSNDFIGWSASCDSSYMPDCHERKAKLLHMQKEVCKRQKQYHQQMQMVLSAFQSVPGLSNATPYISRSLKTISRHFRSLKNAIADQLRHIKRALGEDLSSPTSFLKGDGSSSLRYDRSFVKIKSGGVGGTGQNHVWRPQRGLPERAVSVLRAWLFDHFLHPYPTDNDKQMLATQTGLTRNQVSNWFINARVRLWKPMVEEIHTLETKDSSSRSEPGSSNNSAMPTVAPKNRQLTSSNKFSSCKPPLSLVCDIKQLECSSNSRERSRGREANTEQLFQKCSRIENHHRAPNNMDCSPYLSFLPYESRRELELGDIGVVSLTLGLRHGSDATQQQLQQQFVPQGIPFGGHVIHDFSG